MPSYARNLSSTIAVFGCRIVVTFLGRQHKCSSFISSSTCESWILTLVSGVHPIGVDDSLTSVRHALNERFHVFLRYVVPGASDNSSDAPLGDLAEKRAVLVSLEISLGPVEYFGDGV